MAINPKDFSTFVSDMIATAQARAKQPIDTAIGSLFRAIFEAGSGVALWLQSLIFDLIARTRLSTSSGSDVDTFLADFGQQRVGANKASGNVTFSRFTATNQAFIPDGSLVQFSDGSIKFQVIPDLANAAYSDVLHGYTVNIGVSSVQAQVEALVAGSSGNAQIGQINTLGQGIPYIDTVNNISDLSGGSDQETDAQAKTSFQLYINSLSEATLAAVQRAISSISTNIRYYIQENKTLAGADTSGFFYAVVDDGSGSPSSQFISDTYSAVDRVKALGISFAVYPPIALPVSIAATLILDPAAAYDPAAIRLAVKNAIIAYVNGLGVNVPLSYTRLLTVIYGAAAGIINVTSVTLNGATADIVPAPQQTVKTSSGTVVIS